MATKYEQAKAEAERTAEAWAREAVKGREAQGARVRFVNRSGAGTLIHIWDGRREIHILTRYNMPRRGRVSAIMQEWTGADAKWRDLRRVEFPRAEG